MTPLCHAHLVEQEENHGVVLLTKDGDPSAYVEARDSLDKDRWMEARLKELNSLHKNSTWCLVNLPQVKKLVQCRWLYNKKHNNTYKARLVAWTMPRFSHQLPNLLLFVFCLQLWHSMI